MTQYTKNLLEIIDAIPKEECSLEEYNKLPADQRSVSAIGKHYRHLDDPAEASVLIQGKILRSVNTIKNIAIGVVSLNVLAAIFYVVVFLKLF